MPTYSILKKWPLVTILLLVTIFNLLPSIADAQIVRPFNSRFSVNTNGDVALAGNMTVHCENTDPAFGGNTANCNSSRTGANFNNNDFTMNYVNIDPGAGRFSSSRAFLNIPPGSTVLWAGLYWIGSADAATGPRNTMQLRTPAGSGYNNITATQFDEFNTGGPIGVAYGAFRDVTALVQAGGAGDYFGANVVGALGVVNRHGGWSLFVVFENNALPLRNMTVFDGFIHVNPANTVTIPVSGFLTPLSGPIVSRVGILAGDGDRSFNGDVLAINGVNVLDPDAGNANNFFRSSNNDLGTNNTNRFPAYLNMLGVDLIRVNAPAGVILNGQTSATLRVASSNETVLVPAISFITDIYVPIITPNIVKTFTDVNGGELLPGDVIRWTVTLSNTGFDSGIGLILTDNIPAFTTYVPGSLRVVSGANSVPPTKSDAAGDDQAEYVATPGVPRVVFRLGAGANATVGGSLPFTASTTITFDTALNQAVPSGTLITNSALIVYSGQTIGAMFSASSAAASATIRAAPTVAKSFNPTPINLGNNSLLTIVVTNPSNNSGGLNMVSFTDTYPAGFVNASMPNPQIVCTGGSSGVIAVGTGVGGGNTIGMSSGSLALGGNCTITVTVTGTASGNHLNAINSVNYNGGTVTLSTSTATLSVGKPGITKAFGAAQVVANVPTTMTITLTNTLAVALTNVDFTDTFPTGLQIAPTPGLTNTCGGMITPAIMAGNTALNLTNGAIAAFGNCTITVNVIGTTVGIKTNTASGVSSLQTGAPGLPASASVDVIGNPVTTKTFSPPSVAQNGLSILTIVVTNPNAALIMTGVAFTDTYPAGAPAGVLLNATPANTTINCTAGSSAALVGGIAAGNTLGLTAGILAPNGSCTVSVTVRSATLPAPTNTFANSTGNVTTTNAGIGTAATANLVVTTAAPPNVTKSFVPTNIQEGGTSTLTITLTNPSAAVTINGINFNDAYPANLTNAATPAVMCTGVGSTLTLTGTTGGGSVGASTGVLGPSGVCTVTVSVTSSASASYFNSTGIIQTTNAGTQLTPATATLNVLTAPELVKLFTNAAISTGATTTMRFTINNPNTVTVTGVGVVDLLPAGLTAVNGVTNNLCGAGSVLTIAGMSPTQTVTLTGGTILAAANCIINITVTGATAGIKNNTTGPVNATGPTALTGVVSNTASLLVGLPSIAKSFLVGSVALNGTATMRFTITNVGTAVTALAFNDPLPTGLTAPNGVTAVCGGTQTVTGGNTLAFTGGSLAANASCNIDVTVTGAAAGLWPNQTTALNSSLGVGSPSNVAVIVVNSPPTISKSFSTSAIPLAGTATLSIVVTNPNNSVAYTGLAFTDPLPSGLTAVNNVTAVCGGSLAITGGNLLTFTGGSLSAGSSCTILVTVTGATAGIKNNTTTAVSSTQGGTGTVSNTATITVAPTVPTIAKAFSPTSVAVGDTSTMSFTLTNSNMAATLTGVAFDDTLPAGMTAANGSNAFCGGTLNVSGGNFLVFTGGALSSASNCTITVIVTGTTAGAKNNITTAISATQTGAGATSNTATLTVLSLPDLTIGKTHVGNFTQGQVGATYSILVANIGSSPKPAATTVTVVDTLPVGLTATAIAGTGWSCTLMTLTCTRTDVLNASASYPLITVTVNVNAQTTLVNNAVTVSNAGTDSDLGNNTSIDPTIILAPDLTLAKTSSGTFIVGVDGVFTLTPRNVLGTAASVGVITISDILPAGLTFISAIGTGWTCGAMMQVVTCTSNTVIPIGMASNPIILTVGVGAMAIPGFTNTAVISGGAEPASNNPNNTAINMVAVNVAGMNTFTTDGALAGPPGTSVLYTHTFNAGLAGNVTFSTIEMPSPMVAGWTTQIFRDTNCDGLLNGVEGVMTLSMAVAVMPGDQVCIIVRSNIPANAPQGALNVISVTASFVPTVGPTTLLTRADITTVGTAGSGLTLSKSVRNVTQGGSAVTSNTARPMDLLEYRITYGNSSAVSLNMIVINDAMPAFTGFSSASCVLPLPMLLTVCSVSIQPAFNMGGPIQWTLTGTLLPGQTGRVSFFVTVR